jgi:leader peptidase (prepilin peptidase)/N-methyltransferase
MDIFFSIAFFVFGTILGSFYNVVIYRLPKKISFVSGTSFCPNCNHRIMPIDLIPVVSYIFLGGKCRHCKSPISIRYPMIEALTGFIFVMAYIQYGFTLATLVAITLGSLCIIIAMIDIDTMEILDRFHFFILILAIFQIFLISDLSVIDHIVGFFIISIPFYIIAVLTNGLGGGDIKLIAVSGLLLGYQATLVAFFIAAVLGGLIAVLLLITKQQERKSLIAFGPYLCIGIYIAYLYGQTIFTWYISLII